MRVRKGEKSILGDGRKKNNGRYLTIIVVSFVKRCCFYAVNESKESVGRVFFSFLFFSFPPLLLLL